MTTVVKVEVQASPGHVARVQTVGMPGEQHTAQDIQDGEIGVFSLYGSRRLVITQEAVEGASPMAPEGEAVLKSAAGEVALEDGDPAAKAAE